MDFINKKNDLGELPQGIQNFLNLFLKLAAVLGPRYQTVDAEFKDDAAAQAVGNLSLVNTCLLYTSRCV